MPEGHTIHRLAQDHSRDYVGQRLQASSPQGRFSDGAREINGRKLQAVEAHGKHLCYLWTGGARLHIHLGLYGKFRNHPTPPPDPRGQVRLRVIGDQRAFDLNGPSACQLVTKSQWSAIQNRLGADPLRNDGDVEQVWEKVQRSRMAIGSLLLNQSVIAGVGNIYRSEVLHVLQVHPDAPARSLSREKVESLWSNLQRLLKIGVRYNRIVVADPSDVGKPRSKMNRSERLLVYKKPHCGACDSPIESWVLAARKVYACPKCQKG